MDSPLSEWARRHARDAGGGNAVSDLLTGRTDAEIQEGRGLPRPVVAGIRGFFDQPGGGVRVCDGTACRFGGADALRNRVHACGREPIADVRCLGHCFDGPAMQVDDAVYSHSSTATLDAWLASPPGSPVPAVPSVRIPRASMVPEPVVLRHLLGKPERAIEDHYDLP